MWYTFQDGADPKSSMDTAVTNKQSDTIHSGSLNMAARSGTKKRKKSKQKYKYLYMIPAVLWMVFIFFMSSRTGDGSSAMSNPITDFIVGLFQKVRNDSAQSVDKMTGVVEVMVRKGAHMTEYGILFAFLVLAVRKISGSTSAVWNGIWAVAITFVYACSDEIHQLFVADRAGRGSDVLIDMCGALITLLIIKGMKSAMGRIITGFLIGIVIVAAALFLLLWPF